MTDHGIAGTAHDLVYGERAKTYGHPRIDFDIIANIWTGLLKDKLKDGERLDPYRVAVLMTGLKLARLVQSPDHKDSRIDTIGYMLTMERLDEVEEPEGGYDTDSDFETGPDGQYIYSGDPDLVDDKIRQYGDYGDPAESVTSPPGDPKTWKSLADREIDKLLGRETAEHSQELDAKFDNSVYGPLTSPHHPVNVVLRGFKLVNEIEWAEGDRIEEMNGTSAWKYSQFSNLWFREIPLDPADKKDFRFVLPRSLESLRNEYPALLVTSGVYSRLLLLKNGVGYVAER